MLTTLTVLNYQDSGAGSLRAEIAAAHNGDTINFAPGLIGQTITLTKGELLINKNLTIAGPGAGELTVSGNHASRVFEVANGMQVALNGLTICNGLVVGGDGGGILNSGTLTVSASILSNNSVNSRNKGDNIVGGDGGGIYNGGKLTVSDSSLSGNSAAHYGAGLDNVGMLTVINSAILNNAGNGVVNDSTGTASFSVSTLSGNSAATGGGIWNFGTLTVSACTLSGNAAVRGGGIENFGTLTVSGSTLSNNLASTSGGGIGNVGRGVVIVSGSTLTGNTASNNGSGIYNAGAILTLTGSNVSGNSAGADGGGIWNGAYSTGTVSGCTVSGNSAAQGGGIWNWFSDAQNVLTIKDSSLVTGNVAPVGFGADAYNQGVLDVDGSSIIGTLDGNPAVPI